MSWHSTLIAVPVAIAVAASAPAAEDLRAPGATVQKLAGGLSLAEGPTADAAGNLFFTDQPNHRTLEGSVDGKALTLAGPPSSSSPEGKEAAVLRLLDDWATAYVKHDSAAIDRILGDEFVMSAGRSDLQTRAEYLRKVEDDQEPHASITRDSERVRVYGDVVVVNHRLTRVTRGRSTVFRVTDVCVQRDGRLQLVNRHITELPPPR
jgi:Domain of unknown function (DUF4440)